MKNIEFRIRNLKEGCVDHVWGNPENIYIRASDGIAFYFDGFANCLLEYDDIENISVDRYIGLKDKNGKKIYEGDVVHKDGDEIWSVEYDETTARFVVYNQFNSFRDFDIDVSDYDGVPIIEIFEGKTFKPNVIGNIHRGIR